MSIFSSILHAKQHYVRSIYYGFDKLPTFSEALLINDLYENSYSLDVAEKIMQKHCPYVVVAEVSLMCNELVITVNGVSDRFRCISQDDIIKIDKYIGVRHLYFKNAAYYNALHDIYFKNDKIKDYDL